MRRADRLFHIIQLLRGRRRAVTARWLAANSVVSKVEAVLPARLRPRVANAALCAPTTFASRATSAGLVAVRTALTTRSKLRIGYEKEDGETSHRVIWPLGAFFWGRAWTVTAWCELREDFRDFRLDRIGGMQPTGETFPEDPDRSLRRYFESIGVELDA